MRIIGLEDQAKLGFSEDYDRPWGGFTQYMGSLTRSQTRHERDFVGPPCGVYVGDLSIVMAFSINGQALVIPLSGALHVESFNPIKKGKKEIIVEMNSGLFLAGGDKTYSLAPTGGQQTTQLAYIPLFDDESEPYDTGSIPESMPGVRSLFSSQFDAYRLASFGEHTVKVLHVNPGKILSLQRHRHRDELWYGLDEGLEYLVTPEVSESYEWKPLHRGFAQIPRTMIHRICATSNLETPARFLEVTFGRFDELDIERLEDNYGRAGNSGTGKISPHALARVPSHHG